MTSVDKSVASCGDAPPALALEPQHKFLNKSLIGWMVDNAK